MNNQPEVRIAGEVWDQLTRIRIPGECRQVLDHIILQTHGFQKKPDKISLSQFMAATGIRSKSHVHRALNKLKEMGIILIAKDGNRIAKEYRFNCDHSKWRPLPKRGTFVKQEQGVPKNDNTDVTKQPERSPKEEMTEPVTTEENEDINDLNRWW